MQPDVPLHTAGDFLVDGAPASSALPLPMRAPGSPGRILVVDDDQSFTKGLAQLLRRDGYSVDAAENGVAGLRQLQAYGYDVLVVDLRMPDLDGEVFYGRLLLHAPAMAQRVIFLTGDTLNPDSKAFLERSGRPWVPKPCTAAAIRYVIQHVLQAVALHSARVQKNGEVPTSPSHGERLAPGSPL
jgi:two-component system NtrC family sensor kinase